MSAVFFLIALLAFFAFPCSIIAIIVYKVKLRNVTKQSGDSSAESDLYASYMWNKKVSKIIAVASIPVFLVSVTLSYQYGQEEDFNKNMAKIEKMSEADRNIYEAKYNEIMQEKNGKYTAQKTAIQFVEKNHSNIDRVAKMTDTEKAAFNAKFVAFSKKMSEANARDKALSEIDAEKKKVAEELQKKYDDQAKYEEWVAYQQKEAEEKAAKEKKEAEEKAAKEKREAEEKAEKEKQEAEERKNQELQKMYDDQAKYEEWIAWKQQEEEKQKEEEKKKAAQKAEQENKQASGEKEDDGIFSGVKKFVGGVVDNEVYVGDYADYSIFFKPSSKRMVQKGIIFKDEGYSITILIKDKIHKDNKNARALPMTMEFVEFSDGWEAKGGIAELISKNWVKFDPDDEKIIAKIFNMSKHFPNLGMAE